MIFSTTPTRMGGPSHRRTARSLRALATGETVSGRNETLWRAGREPFPVQISLRAMMDGPEPRGAVLSFTDMTETRAAEETLRRAVQARDEVLAVVSHDLRNPIGTICLCHKPSPDPEPFCGKAAGTSPGGEAVG